MTNSFMGANRKAIISGAAGCLLLISAALRAQESTTKPDQLATTAPSAAFAATQPDIAVNPATQPSPEVLALVNQLGSDDFAARRLAEKNLVAVGPTALPQLRQLLHTDLNDEATARIQSAILQIQEAQILGPSVITLHYSNAPLQDVLDDFARQSGADLGVHRPQIIAYAKARRISVDVERGSFWDALRKVGDASGLHPRPVYGSNAQMTMDIANGAVGPFDMFGESAQSFGPFMIVPQYCQLNRMVQYTRGAASNSSLVLQLLAMVEPKIHVLGQSNTDWLAECVDDKGHSLIVDNQQSLFYNNGRQGWWWQLACNLKEVPDLGTKISRLRGDLKFKVETKSEIVSFDDLSKIKGVTRTVNGTTVTLNSFTETNGVYELHASLTGAATGNGNWNMIQDVVSMISVLGSEDEVISQQSMSSSSTPDAMEVTLTYASMNPNNRVRGISPLSTPRKLRWDVPLETRMLSIPFELNDLKLPPAP